MDSITSYFNDEKLQCTIVAVATTIFIAVSIFFLFQQKVVLKGMAYAILPFSILLLAICLGVIFRTSKDIERVTIFHKEASGNIQLKELPRMEKVMKSFDIIKKVEVVIFIIGLILTLVFWKNELIRGVAFGLIIMSASLYIFDYIADLRGGRYVEVLKSL